MKSRPCSRCGYAAAGYRCAKSTASPTSCDAIEARGRKARGGERLCVHRTDGGISESEFLERENLVSTIDAAKLRRRTFYQTRHTFSSNALAAGENPKWVADMLGHKSTQILFDVYEKFIPRRTRLDGSALLARMKEESGQKNEPMSAPQYDRFAVCPTSRLSISIT